MPIPYPDVKRYPRSTWTEFVPSTCSHQDPDTRRGTAVHWPGTTERLVRDLLARGHGACLTYVAGVEHQHLNDPEYPYCAIEYSYVACPHGHLITGRGKYVRTGANGTTEANVSHGAVLVLVGITEEATPAQLHAVRAAGAVIAPQAPRAYRPHSAFVATACPGDKLRGWIDAGARDPYAGILGRIRKLTHRITGLRRRRAGLHAKLNP